MEVETAVLSDLKIEHLIGLLISIGMGFLVGIERQFSKEAREHEEQFAGIRTFTLVSILGFISGMLSSLIGAWIFGAILVCVFAFVIVSYLQMSKLPGNKGATSEFALLITFILGGLVFLKMVLFALIVMVVMLLLLTFKPVLHLFVEKLERKEILAMVLFVIISALVIPFLPDKNFGPYQLWNLKEIWQMVVLVAGTSLVGYMIAKFMGERGTIIAGLVGGLVSSTSVTLTFSRKSKETISKSSSFYYAMGIISACTMMFPKVLFEVYIINWDLFLDLWIPILLISIAGFSSAFFIYTLRKENPAGDGVILKNPLDLATAIKFAVLYALVQWFVKYAGDNFGDSGTYIAGAISGITDVDAITLSMAKMAKSGGDSAIAVNTILIAALSNTLVKFMIVLSLGSIELRKIAFLAFCAIFFTGSAYFLFFTNF